LEQNKLEKVFARFGNFKSKFILYVLISFLIAIAAAAVLLIFSTFIFQIIDPENKYYLASSVTPYLAIGLVPGTMMAILSYFTVFYHGEKFELYTNLIVAILGIAAYIILIPRYGIVGAAIGNIVIYTTGMLLEIYFLKKVLKTRKNS
jgi:O-antigen/teichoic acid export membrane protein